MGGVSVRVGGNKGEEARLRGRQHLSARLSNVLSLFLLVPCAAMCVWLAGCACDYFRQGGEDARDEDRGGVRKAKGRGEGRLASAGQHGPDLLAPPVCLVRLRLSVCARGRACEQEGWVYTAGGVSTQME